MNSDDLLSVENMPELLARLVEGTELRLSDTDGSTTVIKRVGVGKYRFSAPGKPALNLTYRHLEQALKTWAAVKDNG